jgi:hypothetical protein
VGEDQRVSREANSTVREGPNDHAQVEALLITLLPPQYQQTFEDLQPISMGSAGLKFAADGTVAWDEMWGSFCDLAMAGGPPHKGTLLEPGTEAAIDADFPRYDEVLEEICRGIRMVTGLRAYPSPAPGWVRVACLSEAMSGWLLRAITMENVSARRRGSVLELPASPHFRLEKEIKNVITVIAKTCHYWLGHIQAEQQREIGELFMRMTAVAPLLEPDRSPGSARLDRKLVQQIAARIERETGLPSVPGRYSGWLGVECPSVAAAVWMMRALVAHNVLSRREGIVLFVPINAALDPSGDLLANAVASVHRYTSAREVV